MPIFPPYAFKAIGSFDVFPKLKDSMLPNDPFPEVIATIQFVAVVAVRIWPATSNGALGAVDPIPTLAVAIRVDVVMVDLAFKELTPSVENIVVPPLPPLPPVPGGKPLILETVSVDRTRSLDVMLDTDSDDADMINPVSIDMVNVDPVIVETDRVDAINDDTFEMIGFSVETLMIDAVSVDPVIVETDRVDAVNDDTFEMIGFSVETLMIDAVIVDPVMVLPLRVLVLRELAVIVLPLRVLVVIVLAVTELTRMVDPWIPLVEILFTHVGALFVLAILMYPGGTGVPELVTAIVLTRVR